MYVQSTVSLITVSLVKLNLLSLVVSLLHLYRRRECVAVHGDRRLGPFACEHAILVRTLSAQAHRRAIVHLPARIPQVAAAVHCVVVFPAAATAHPTVAEPAVVATREQERRNVRRYVVEGPRGWDFVLVDGGRELHRVRLHLRARRARFAKERRTLRRRRRALRLEELPEHSKSRVRETLSRNVLELPAQVQDSE